MFVHPSRDSFGAQFRDSNDSPESRSQLQATGKRFVSRIFLIVEFQAEFSFVTWPFSLKLLWAPIVDSIFSSRVGRRKTWLIPTQYLIGAFMLLLSGHVEQWLGSEGVEPNIEILTFLFFSLNFLAATQDIAVDGWALTMLKKRNVGHASTCNSVGQTAGFFLSYVVFMALESASFCNMYMRSEPEDTGIVTLPGFLYFWGWVFVVSTTLVALLKKEVEPRDSEHEVVHDRDVQTAYKSLKDILALRPVQTLVIILLTCKVCGYELLMTLSIYLFIFCCFRLDFLQLIA